MKPIRWRLVAVTLAAAFTTTVQGSVPAQPPPDQPAKANPVEGAVFLELAL